eukprot:s152_g12.t2
MPNLVNWALLGTAQWKRFSLALQLSYFLKFSRTVCDILKECHTELRGSSWWFHCFLRDVLHQGFLKMDIQIDMNPVQLVHVTCIDRPFAVTRLDRAVHRFMAWLWPGAAGHFQLAGREVIQESLLADGGFAYVQGSLAPLAPAGASQKEKSHAFGCAKFAICRDARSGEALAIRKALLQDAEAQQAARLEIALLRRLPHHDSIVRFLGAEILEGDAGASSRKLQAVSLFELCTGGTLFARVEAVKQQRTAGEGMGPQRYCCPCLPEAEVLAVLRNASAALVHLHAEGVIHYDVKSENLMLGADGLWKLGDFGSASERSFDFQGAPRKLMLEAEEFVHGRCTPIFRAPELADVHLRWPIGPKVDLFALGCVLFACLTGVHPFPMDSALANIQARYQVPPEAEAYAPVLLRWLKALLQRHPAERPTAAVLLAQVQTFLSTGTAEDLPDPTEPAPEPLALPPAAECPAEPWVADFSQMPGFEPFEVSVTGAGSEPQSYWTADLFPAIMASCFWSLLHSIVLADASTIKLMMLHNSAQSNAGWREGFDFFVPWFNAQGGFTMSADGQSYTLDVVLCEEALDSDASTKVQGCVNQAQSQNVDAIIVGTSSANDDVKAAAEAYSIPNLHCSGGNPMAWTASTPHAFGLHLPFPWYSRGPIRQAALLELKTIVVLRNYEWGFPRISAVAAMEWSLESAMTVIGPTVAWCDQWANMTTTCSIRNGACRCGEQSEFDAMGYKYQADTMPSFYEVTESKVTETGFDNRAEFISPNMVAFIEGVIDDVRSQGADPEMVVNWLTAARSGLVAMRNKKFEYKMYFGGPNDPGTKWNGYESYWNNGTTALGPDEALYNVGGGQWHHEMGFSDPYFGSTQAMVSAYYTQLGKNPTYDGAACMAAGIAVSFGLQKYGQSLTGMTVAQRRDEIRISVGTLNDETLYGMVRFNRFNQNNGRLTVNWQVLEDGGTRPVLPPDAAATQFRFPSPSWDARLGCPPGSYADGLLQLPTQCTACPEGRARSLPSPGLNFTQCDVCPMGYGTLPAQTGLLECPACPAGRYQNGDSDRGVCNQCPLGTSRAANSSGGCSLCAAQSYADVTGLDACKPCPARSSQGDLGQTFCFCDVGNYKDPADRIPVGTVLPCLSCESVIPGSTTLYPNSRYSHECVCPTGTYFHRLGAESNVGHCQSCGLGLVCLGGREPGVSTNSSAPPHQAPLQQEGYAAGAPAYSGGSPSFIVECSSSVTCPGGLALGVCPGSNSGIACMDCLPDHYKDNGICYSCAEAGFALWPLIIAFGLALIVLLGLYTFATKVDKPHRDSMMTVTIGAGLSLATLQALSAFSKVEVQWVEPLQTLRSVFAFLIFDISILRPGCFLGNTNPVLHYLGSLMVWPMVAGGIMATWWRMGRQWSAGEFSRCFCCGNGREGNEWCTLDISCHALLGYEQNR